MQKKVDVRAFLRQHWLWCATILLIALSRFCWYGMLQPYKVLEDSKDYLAFDTLAMLQGRPVNGRPPLYGMFLDLLEWLFPSNFLTVAALIQAVVSVISLVFLAKLLRHIGVSSPWRELCVLFYGATSAVLGWEPCIMTESFSLSGAVFFLYCAVLYIQRHRLRYGLGALLLALALAFLRPQFLVYLALLLVFFVLKLIFPYERSERRTLCALLLASLACWGFVLSYCWGFQKQFGIFSLSDALPRQNLAICLERGYAQELDDREIADFVTQQEEEKDPLQVATEAVARYGNARVDKTTKQFFLSHFSRYLSDTISAALATANEAFFGYAYNTTDGWNTHAWGGFFSIYSVQRLLFDGVKIFYALLASALEGIAMVAVWIKRRTMPWLHMALFSISVCTTFLTYFVTCGEYMRTMISILPYFFCMAGLFLQMCSDYAARVRAAQPANTQ